MIKEIDITKMKPFDWKWLLALLFVVVIVGSVVGLGMYLKTRIAALVPKAQVEEEVI